jgi:hypothetical protein
MMICSPLEYTLYLMDIIFRVFTKQLVSLVLLTNSLSTEVPKGGGERTDQSESAACPPHPLSHTIDMAFGD